MYMDVIKLFAKNEKELKILKRTISLYNQDIWIEFGVGKMCHAHNEMWKNYITEGIGLPNQERMRMLGKKENKKIGNIWTSSNCGEEK